MALVVMVVGAPASGASSLVRELGGVLEDYKTYSPQLKPSRWLEALNEVRALASPVV